jgi:hypothetical protein
MYFQDGFLYAECNFLYVHLSSNKSKVHGCLHHFISTECQETYKGSLTWEAISRIPEISGTKKIFSVSNFPQILKETKMGQTQFLVGDISYI